MRLRLPRFSASVFRTIPAIFVVAGGALAVIGSFLPWATVTCQCYLDPNSVMYMGAGVSPIVHGTDTPNLGGSTLAWVGAIVLLLGVSSLLPRHRQPFLAVAFVVVACAALSSLPFSDYDDIGAALGMSSGFSVGPGVYVANAGVVIAAVASLIGFVVGVRGEDHDGVRV